MKSTMEQKNRSRRGQFGKHWYLNTIYLSLILFVALTTPYCAQYPAVILCFIGLELVLVVGCGYMGRIETAMPFGSTLIKGHCAFAVNPGTVVWSAFTVTTLWLYGLSQTGQLVTLLTISLTIVSFALMVPMSVFMKSHVMILTAPFGIWGVFSQTSIGYVLSFFCLLGVFCLLRINRLNIEDPTLAACFQNRTLELEAINKELESEILYRKNMEKALRRSEERYRTLFQNNPIETIIVDHNGRITGYNSAKARSQGRVPEIGDIMYKDYGSRHANNMFDELMDCIRSGCQKEFPEQKYNQRFLHIRISPFTGGAIITSLDITKTKRAEEQIQILTREIMRVQENERKRIARDLHDSVAQDLSSLRISCETFFDDNRTDSNRVKHKLREMSRVLHGSIHAVREIAYELRPPGLDELGLPITLYRYCEEFGERTGIAVDFFSAGLDQIRLDPDSEINLYRLVQEALNNIRKHSQAHQASIRLVASYPNVILRIDDNGVGFEPDAPCTIEGPNKHMGLRSMEERVNLLGGKLRLKSRPGGGTSVYVEVPLLKAFHETPSSASLNGLNA